MRFSYETVHAVHLLVFIFPQCHTDFQVAQAAIVLIKHVRATIMETISSAFAALHSARKPSVLFEVCSISWTH